MSSAFTLCHHKAVSQKSPETNYPRWLHWEIGGSGFTRRYQTQHVSSRNVPIKLTKAQSKRPLRWSLVYSRRTNGQRQPIKCFFRERKKRRVSKQTWPTIKKKNILLGLLKPHLCFQCRLNLYTKPRSVSLTGIVSSLLSNMSMFGTCFILKWLKQPNCKPNKTRGKSVSFWFFFFLSPSRNASARN